MLLKEPRSTLSWHKDPEPRLHIPIITNLGCSMVIENIAKHLPADGKVTITNNTKYHNFFNGGEQSRIPSSCMCFRKSFQKKLKSIFKKICIASDHAGFNLKDYIKDLLIYNNISVIDLGTKDNNSVDYPDYAKKVSSRVKSGKSDVGILVCGSGTGDGNKC